MRQTSKPFRRRRWAEAGPTLGGARWKAKNAAGDTVGREPGELSGEAAHAGVSKGRTNESRPARSERRRGVREGSESRARSGAVEAEADGGPGPALELNVVRG